MGLLQSLANGIKNAEHGVAQGFQAATQPLINNRQPVPRVLQPVQGAPTPHSLSPRLLTDTGDVGMTTVPPGENVYQYNYPNLLKGLVFGNNQQPVGQGVMTPQVVGRGLFRNAGQNSTWFQDANNSHYMTSPYSMPPTPQTIDAPITQSSYARPVYAQPKYLAPQNAVPPQSRII